MNIDIRDIKKAKLNKQALIKVIKRFYKLRKNVRLVFKRSLSCCGLYTYLSKQKTHRVEVSTTSYKFSDRNARIYEMIGTILHELKHAEQQERLGIAKMMGSKFHGNHRIKSYWASDFFSICENEARIAEETNLMSAVDYYWKNCDNVVM